MFVEKARQNHLKNRYVCSVDGPIFFTAPHSKKLVRGGPAFDEKKRIHLRQLYTSYLACRLAMQTKGSNSFCFWGKTVAIDDKELDPNYLFPDMFKHNPFHQSLHYWATKNQGLPLLHIDVHGKFDRKNNCDIDVGILSMEVHWKDQFKLIESIKQFFHEHLTPIFKGIEMNKFQCKFNTEPSLHGYWKGKMCTMTQQSILLGIPSFQLQIPRTIRKLLFKDQKLLKAFSRGLRKLYQNLIVPWNSSKKLNIEKQLALKFKQTVKDKQQRQHCLQQVSLFEKKEELNLNVKYV